MFSYRKLILNRTYDAKKKERENTRNMTTLKGGTTKENEN